MNLLKSAGRATLLSPPDVRCFLLPNLDIVGGKEGGGGGGGGGGRDCLHCTKFIAGKCAESSGLVDMAAVDLQIACTILRMCGGFCRMVHIARVTPPSGASEL